MTNPQAQDDDLWADGARDVKGACEFLGMSRSQLYRMMDDSKVVYALVGGKRLVAVRSMKRLLQQAQAGASA